MKLILEEIKYNIFTLLLFSAFFTLLAIMLIKPNAAIVFRLNPIIFTIGVLLYNLLYRKDEKSERFLVTLPINMRLIPMLRYVTPITFWLFSQILFFTVSGSLGLSINLLNEIFISYKVTGILMILMSLTFIYIDKFLEYGSNKGLKILFIPLLLTLLFVLIMLYSLLPLNVINTSGLQNFFFIKESIIIFWESELSLIIISFGSILSVILNIELHAKKNIYLN